ncbi:MAG TPA: heme-binding protein [Chloroflexota bacterium]|nr:heme-binding protein [Chloroflexota bacterium]
MLLTLADARRYADAAIAAAGAQNLRVAVAVVDEAGQLLQLDRMDGALLMGPDVALAKAVTALNFQRPTSSVAELARGHPDLVRSLQQAVRFPITAAGGGVPIARNGTVVGAIGVSGSTAEQDEALAQAALGGV